MLEAVLDEADRVGKSDAAILAAVPFTVPSSTSKALVRRVNGNAGGNTRQQHSPPPLPNMLDTGKSGDGVKPSVNQLNECRPCLLLASLPDPL